MALYFVSQGNEAVLLVRARNGRVAQELSGLQDPDCHRVREEGEEGVLGHDGNVLGAQLVSSDQPGNEPAREVEITSLADIGVRRFTNLDTGEERTEPRE